MWLKIGNRIINMELITDIFIHDNKIEMYDINNEMTTFLKEEEIFDALKDYLEHKFESYVI